VCQRPDKPLDITFDGEDFSLMTANGQIYSKSRLQHSAVSSYYLCALTAAKCIATGFLSSSPGS
jgi:hypothetical protein